MGHWLAGKLMKDLDIASFQAPAHKYKRGGNEHVEMLNHLDRQFTVTAPDQVRCGDLHLDRKVLGHVDVAGLGTDSQSVADSLGDEEHLRFLSH
ncbi:hypothetical protein SERMPA_00061 (plasmid) [Serratia marcescens]|nr:Uncharacterised protein [Serratia marcescens]